MKFGLYLGFGFVAIASALVALVRLALGQDASEVIPPNVVIGSVCLVVMMLLYYRGRKKIERRN